MSYEVKYTARFKRDYKRMKKRGKDVSKLLDVIDMLREGQALPPQYQDHPLHGDYEGHRDCHVEPDWVLIYYKSETGIGSVAYANRVTQRCLLNMLLVTRNTPRRD